MGSVPVFGWRKSSFSSSGGDCVELTASGVIRDSKNPAGPALRADLRRLVAVIKAGKLAR